MERQEGFIDEQNRYRVCKLKRGLWIETSTKRLKRSISEVFKKIKSKDQRI